jgi:hypothetical protein
MPHDKTKVSYTCEICHYISSNRSDYERHLMTRKHQENASYHTKTPPSTTDPYTCASCKKVFKHRTSIYKHKPICHGYPALVENTTSSVSALPTPAGTEQYLCEVITKNQELTAAMIMLIQQNTELQSKMMEICKSGGLGGVSNSHNTNTNSLNTTNNNQQYSMNFFLNEQCKDAMNMKDFVNSIQLNITDLENVGRLGYVEGMSNILIDNLEKTDIYKRPVHCSDIKRETLYVKDDNKWEREGPDHSKMMNAVLAVEQKNVALVGEWAKANPKCMNSNTRENERYFKLSKAVTDGEKDGNIAKVIRRIAKKVVIEKESP